MAEFSFAKWLTEGGDRNLSKFVYDKSYERVSWVYACVNRIADSLSGLPLEFYIKDKLIEDHNHPVNKAFGVPDYPKVLSIRQLFKQTLAHLELHGGVYWVIPSPRRNNLSDGIKIMALIRLRPILSTSKELVGWQETDALKDTITTYTTDEVVPFFYYHPDYDMAGLAPLRAARLAIEQEFFMSAWNAAFFKQGLRNPLAIMSKDRLTSIQEREMKKRLIKYYAGLDNGQGALILGRGSEVKELGVSNDDISFLEGKELSREEICGTFGVPPAMVGIFRYANHANSKEQNVIFWENTASPKLAFLAETVQVLVLDKWFPGVTCKWDKSSIAALRRDPIESATAAKTYFDLGYNAEQVSVILGIPELADRADIPLPPLPPLPPPEEDEEDEDQPEPEETDEDAKTKSLDPYTWLETYAELHSSLMELNEGKWLRRFKVYFKSAGDALETKITRKEAVVLDSELWVKLWDEFIHKLVTDSFELSARVVLYEIAKPEVKSPGFAFVSYKSVGISEYMTEQEMARFRRAIQEFASKTTGVGQDIINDLNKRAASILEAGGTTQDLRKGVAQVVREAYKGRSLTIARTISNGAYNASRFTVYEMKGVTYHQWVSAGDEHVRPEHSSEGGNITLFGTGFPVTQLRYPHDPNGRAAQVINCRCTTVPVQVKETPVSRPVSHSIEQKIESVAVEAYKEATTQTLNTLGSGGRLENRFMVDSITNVTESRHMLDWAKRVFNSRSIETLDTLLDLRPPIHHTKVFKVVNGNNKYWTHKNRQKLASLLTKGIKPSLRSKLPQVEIKFVGTTELAEIAEYRNNVIRLSASNEVPLYKLLSSDFKEGDLLEVSDLYQALADLAHEYGHHLQENGLASWAKNFYTVRTVGEGFLTITLSDGRVINYKEDQFFDWYQGRSYLEDGVVLENKEIVSVFYEKLIMVISASKLFKALPADFIGLWVEKVAPMFLTSNSGYREAFKAIIGEDWLDGN